MRAWWFSGSRDIYSRDRGYKIYVLETIKYTYPRTKYKKFRMNLSNMAFWKLQFLLRAWP